MGHNGGPDWRALIAGEDAKAIETLSRYKEPGEFLKAHNELRAKLSERPAVARLPDMPTPEQIAEHRKAIGLADIPKDAKSEVYLEAYKIKAPDGYELTNVEKGMLEGFAKHAYETGADQRSVKTAVDFFFQSQAANAQMMNRIAVDFQKQEQSKLRDEIGSREYDARQAAGEAWLKQQFADNPNGLADLLNAQMPSGGKIGDSAWFFNLVAEKAMGAGFTDRIESNSLESGGKSLAEQQRELESLRLKDRSKYNEPATQDRLKKIITLRQNRGEIDEWGNERKRA